MLHDPPYRSVFFYSLSRLSLSPPPPELPPCIKILIGQGNVFLLMSLALRQKLNLFKKDVLPYIQVLYFLIYLPTLSQRQWSYSVEQEDYYE
jgi:hypothetical protein